MGNLINPNLVRLNNNINWKSNWVSYQNSNYSYILSHDYLLSSYINWILKENYFLDFGWILYFSHYKVLRYNNLFMIIFFFKDYSFKNFLLSFLEKFNTEKKFKNNRRYNKNNRNNKFKSNTNNRYNNKFSNNKKTVPFFKFSYLKDNNPKFKSKLPFGLTWVDVKDMDSKKFKLVLNKYLESQKKPISKVINNKKININFNSNILGKVANYNLFFSSLINSFKQELSLYNNIERGIRLFFRYKPINKLNKKSKSILRIRSGNIISLQKLINLSLFKIYLLFFVPNNLLKVKNINTWYLFIYFIFNCINKRNHKVFSEIKFSNNILNFSFREVYNYFEILFFLLKKEILLKSKIYNFFKFYFLKSKVYLNKELTSFNSDKNSILLNNLKIKKLLKNNTTKKLEDKDKLIKFSDENNLLRDNNSLNIIINKKKLIYNKKKLDNFTTSLFNLKYKNVLNLFNYYYSLNNINNTNLIKFNKVITRNSLKRNYFLNFYNLFSSNTISITNLVKKKKKLRKKFLFNYNLDLYYFIGYSNYKSFLQNNYRSVGLNIRKDINNLESVIGNYYYSLSKVNNNNILLSLKQVNLNKFKYKHNIYNTFNNKKLDVIISRFKNYNFLTTLLLKYIFLTYKNFFYNFSGLLKFNYLYNCHLYLYLLKGNQLTSKLITNYVSRNLKIGHSLNRIIYPLIRFLSDSSKSLYLGWKIGGSGRFQRRGRARKQWFIKGKVPLSTLISNVDYDSQPVRLRNGVCNIKVFIIRKKNFHYNI